MSGCEGRWLGRRDMEWNRKHEVSQDANFNTVRWSWRHSRNILISLPFLTALWCWTVFRIPIYCTSFNVELLGYFDHIPHHDDQSSSIAGFDQQQSEFGGRRILLRLPPKSGMLLELQVAKNIAYSSPNSDQSHSFLQKEDLVESAWTLGGKESPPSTCYVVLSR